MEENIVGEHLRHGYLAESAALSAEERALFSRIAGSHGEDQLPTNSLLLLSRLLFQHHGQRAVILIDEYDAPVMSASANHYYREAVTFMKMRATIPPTMLRCRTTPASGGPCASPTPRSASCTARRSSSASPPSP
ncbi:hypothetical protein DX903_04545 [Adlercreutzia equolifaciens]|nr:hypothetical protein DX903_04545 [Adlercreutzia equolifaciens]